MPGKSPTLYDVKKTTVWFAIASLILLVSLIAMIAQDGNREWKDWQRKFMKYSREKAQQELEQVKKAVNQAEIAKLEEQLKAAKEEIKNQKSVISGLQKEVDKADLGVTVAKSLYQNLQQYQDSDKYFFEEHRLHGHDEEAAKYEKQLKQRKMEIKEAKIGLEGAEVVLEEKKAALKKITDNVSGTEKEIARLNSEITRVEEKIQKLTFDWKSFILNAPMLDFMNPTLRVQQAVVENIHEDLYYVNVPRVDRCTTCHLAIDQKGFEDAPQPFTTHPNLDLYLSSDSPHKLEEFGCTSCHGGSGHSISFTTTAHTPDSPEQAKEWKEKYDWHAMKHWTEKMYPMKYIEASCAKCHTGVVEVPEAPKLNEGRRIAREYGCFACHKVKGFEDHWEVGPSLDHVQSKLEEDWMIKWLHDPKEFRPSTKMPRIFHLSNAQDSESVDKDNAAIAGIAAYLMKNSDPIALEEPPAGGDPVEGERIIQEIGCLGCHSIGDSQAADHGPELSGLGSKVKADWLYTWVKNPKLYHPDSQMPDLRLTDEEAAHVTSYLLQSKNEKFDSTSLPIVKQEAVDDLALGFLTGNMRHEEAKSKLGGMSENEKLEYVGKKMINRQGCFSCHDIKGFEDASPIGAELSHHGSKDLGKFEFGFTKIDHTRQAWFEQKLKEPRIFDKGKVKPYMDKLRMPQFDFSDEQVEALTTFLLSLKKGTMPLEVQDVLSDKEKEIEKGRLLVQKYNCTGCHTLDGKEGLIRSITDDEGLMPPVLDGEGDKVKELWLYHFLDKPTTIRPWLKYRMPSFELDPEELTTFVNYFTHLADVHDTYIANATPETTPEMIEAGRELFKAFQCIKCHQSDPPKGLSASFLAPDLVIAKDRLRPGWIVDWLEDPQVIQEGTMMPTFFYDGESPMEDVLGGDAKKQMEAMRDYMMVFDEAEAKKIMQPSKPETTTSAS